MGSGFQNVRQKYVIISNGKTFILLWLILSFFETQKTQKFSAFFPFVVNILYLKYKKHKRY